MAKDTLSRQIGKKSAQAKGQILADTADLLQRSQAVLLTDYRGLTVPQISTVRKQLREAESDFSVVKNTLFKRASEGIVPIDPQLDACLNGPTAAVFVLGDPVKAAKAVTDYIVANRNTPLKIKGGLISGKFLTAAQVDALSKVPSREVLIAQMLGAFNAPVTNLVGTLQGVLSNFVYTLKAIEEKKAAT